MDKLRGLFIHLAVFVVAQIIFLVIGQSWPAAFLAGQVPGDTPILMDVSKWWCLVIAIDIAWNLYKAFSAGSASTGNR